VGYWYAAPPALGAQHMETVHALRYFSGQPPVSTIAASIAVISRMVSASAATIRR
jgi:hypothetical protein